MKKKETISLFELVQFSISFPYPSFTFVLIQSHSLHAIYPIFLFPLILEQGKPSSDRIVHARADQSHLLRRSVTEHVTSVHLVRVPTASRCQPRRSGTGRDACPLPPLPFLSSLYPNETKRSDRTGRALETHPPSSPTQSRASTKLLLLITLTLYIIHFFLSLSLAISSVPIRFLLARRKNSSR